MNRRPILSSLAVGTTAVLLVGVLGGCAHSSTQPPAATGNATIADGSVPTSYLSAKELAADATDLVYGEVLSSSAEKIADLAVTRYSVQVEKNYGGSADGTIAVYQTGLSDWVMSVALAPHLQVGRKYVLFIQPLGIPTETDKDDGFAVVGTGAWGASGASLELYKNPDEEIDYGTIPEKLSLADVPVALYADALASNR